MLAFLRGLTVDVRLLETFSWSKMKVSCHLKTEGNVSDANVDNNHNNNVTVITPRGFPHLVDLQEAVDLAAFVLLLLHLLREPLPLALLDGVCVLEGPASPPVRLPHVVAGVAAPDASYCKLKIRSLLLQIFF